MSFCASRLDQYNLENQGNLSRTQVRSDSLSYHLTGWRTIRMSLMNLNVSDCRLI